MIQLNTIHNQNCVDGLSLLDNASVDLTVTSPPYDSLRLYEGAKWDFDVFSKVANLLFAKTKQGGVVVWVVGDGTIDGSETGTSFRQALYFQEIGFRIHDTMIYEKTGTPYPGKNRYYQNFEYMFVFSKGKPKTVNLIKDKQNSNAGKPAHWGRMTFRQKDGSLVEKGSNYITPEFGVRTNIWKYKTGHGNVTTDRAAYRHPAIFPDALAIDHILSWSNEGDLICDPFAGSGTTLKAANSLKRQFIGFEISKTYVDIAYERLNIQKT